MPLLLLSGVFLPLTLAPGVLQKIAGLNPFAYAVDASWALINGNPGDVAVLSLVWATRSMRRVLFCQPYRSSDAR
jgi:ABC-2 type transport system permease protein